MLRVSIATFVLLGATVTGCRGPERIALTPQKDFRGWKRVVLPSDPPMRPASPWSLSADGQILSCKGEGTIKELFLHETPRGDGVFHVEWRVVNLPEGKKDYNGGVYVRTSLDGITWTQAQVAESEKRPIVGDLFAEVPDPAAGKPKRVQVLSESPFAGKPRGEWNTFEIACQGSRIILSVNGAITAGWNECPVREGHLGLQVEFFDLEFRNLWWEAAQ